MKKPVKLLILIAVVAAAGVFASKKLKLTDADADGVIRISGNIEVTSAQVAFRIPGRVTTRLVSEGDAVTNGQVVAYLETTELEQDLAMRESEVLAAKAALDELEAGSRQEDIEQAAAALAAARADDERAAGELNRQKGLYEGDVISDREFEAASAAAAVASARVDEALARLALLEKGPREETIRAARARLRQASQSVALAETRLGYATLRSPLDGIVMAEVLESGEFAAAGTPVVTVGDLANVWLRGYVNESDLGRVKIGQVVEVVADTYPGEVYPGRLSFIASEAEFTPKNVQTAEERVKLVYRIKVDIANPDQELKPGMPADATIAVQ